MDKDQKMRQGVKDFKLATSKQHQQDREDRLKFIKNCVQGYNKLLLDGEAKITVQEMAERLERKG